MKILENIILLYNKKINPKKYAKNKGVKIGENSRFIGAPILGSEPYLITIGDHVTVSFDVAFITHDGGTWVFREKVRYKNVIKYGKITINDNSFIGARSTILPGVTIGPNSVVAAGSVVVKDVLPNSVFGGVPAKFICSIDEYAEKCFKNTPLYDVESYKKDKKKEVLRILD